MNTKNFTTIVFCGLIIFFGVSVATAEIERQNGDNAGQAKQAFCSRIDDLANKVSQRMTDNANKISTHRTERGEALIRREGELADILARNRAKWDENRGANYAKLKERAQTDTQKQAVEKFKSDIEAAVAARKTAIDKALADFEAGLDSVLSERKNSVDAAVKAFTDSVNLAISEAKNSCSADGDAKTVRATLSAALKAARGKLDTDIVGINNLRDKIAPLIDTRKQAISQAVEDFKAVAESAKSELKLAFPEP